MNTWLLLDCPQMCHKALHTVGPLSYEGMPTGTTFGFLKELKHLQDIHNTDKVVFAWDSPPLLRKKAYPTYKSNRGQAPLTKVEALAVVDFRRQVINLRDHILPELGHRNVFSQPGYEADDIIASVCLDLPEGDQAIIVSSDEDFYQLLSPRVKIWKKRGTYTQECLVQEYGVSPPQWAMAKALAGCDTDNVPGISGVGVITACKYLSGNLNPKWKSYKAIETGKGITETTFPLVNLPFPGVRSFPLRDDECSSAKWYGVCKRLGMKSLMGRG